ncbi:MAG: hypothetical protein FWD70_07960 [Desulfuromonadales bacterium]|nr:hypothetical protein [Desulfuromonadales bacterium]
MEQKRRTKEEWKLIVEEQKTSGLTQERWCKTKGINYQTFKNRARLMRRQREQEIAPKVEWVEAQGKEAVKKTESIIQIEMGEVRVKVPDGISETSLQRVCKVLVGLC